MTTRLWIYGWCIAGAAAMLPLRIEAQQVTPQRLAAAASEPQNWLTYSGNYASTRFTPLAQITPANVRNLKLQWVYQSPVAGNWQTTPLVVDGVMYLTQRLNDVVALDAATGRAFWIYRYTPSADRIVCCGANNRGLAILGNTLFMATLDAQLIAIDARSGRKIWQTEVAVTKAGYSMTLAPLVVKDKVIVGVGGGEYGIRGFVAAYDANTGKEAWRFYTIPAPGEPGVEFGVLALGDTAYVEFCAIGRALDERLAALGGKRVADRVDCDLDFAEPAAKWIGATLKTLAPEAAPDTKVIAVDFGAKAAPNLDVVEAQVTEHINLNSSRSNKETIHLELAFDGAAPAYKPGDSLDLYAENDPAHVDALLQSARISDPALRAEFIKNRDVTTLSLKTVETYAGFGQRYVKELLDAGTARNWIAGRQLIDLVQEFPVALDAEKLRALTRPLAPRAYSIASSRAEVGDEAHLLISAVRYRTHNRARKGVASNFVADRLKKGAKLRVKLKPNKHFALPAPDRDIIMVGPGTGVAPFRAFVQERRATQAKGRSWLFFGDRTFTHDFLYQLEWQDALRDGGLARMDVAFSRDTPEKVYVQHRVWEKRVELVAWLDGGATFYVCGDMNAMAKDVRATLVRAYADVKAISPEAAEQAVAALERDKRYQQDVY